MRVWVLGSGSRGNAVVVDTGASRVLIDVGFGPRILKKRLEACGIAPESIEACVVTHEHSDHIRGAARGARRWHWPLFMTEGTYANSHLPALGVPAVTFAPGRTIELPGLIVETFRIPHDAAQPIGCIVTEQSSGVRAGICTDVGSATRSLRRMAADVDILVIESNHDEDMLANGPYPPTLQRRIASSVGHLSNRDCSALVEESGTRRLRQVVLAHLSEENNTPAIAYESMRDALRRIAFRGALLPALQDSVVGPFTLRHTKGQEQLSLAL